MKRLLYLAVLSMAILTVSAPAALAQQGGGGLCPGTVAVTSLSGSAADGEVESEPFDISTDLFQVAVDNTSVAPEGEEGSTFVEVARPGFTGFESMDFGDGEDGIFNVSNTGDGPFVVRASSDLQSYDITVYECPQGPPLGGGGDDPEGPDGGANGGTDDETTDPETTDPETTDPETTDPETTDPETTTMEETTPNNSDDQYPPQQPQQPPITEGQYPPEQPQEQLEPQEQPPAGTSGTGTAEGDDPDEGGAVPILPDTGGASLFVLGAGALLVAGGLLARRILR